jgi:predicted dehydrogenase
MADSVKVGVIGCGAISGAYLSMAKHLPILDIVALADLDRAKAEARAAEFGVPRVLDVDELLADSKIQVVLNLTVPKAHAPLAMAALAAGKHVFTEKPLGVNRDEGRQVLETAASRGLRVGCAPDTFLGAGLQTARHAVDEGLIGRPVGFTAFMLCRGHENWHPSPEFFYEAGGGPMFDMGPYYLTALLNLLGPVRRYGGMASIAIPQRTITSAPKHGQHITVQTPDHICGTLEFVDGAVGTIITSFATHFPVTGPPITLYGEEGTLEVCDPNGFDGGIRVRTPGDEDWVDLEPRFLTGYGRAVGLADMCTALASGRPHRCSGEQAFAVLDLMQGFLDSSEAGRCLTPELVYERPAPMRADLPFGTLD